MPPKPYYKQKFPREKYKNMGDPLALKESDLPDFQAWKPIIEEKKLMWMDSKAVVDQRNKKREYLVEYNESPRRTSDGKYQMEIEMLHVDKRGFIYTAEADDIETLNREFWPVVEWLIAEFFAPKLRMPPPVKVPGGEEGDTGYRKDSYARFMAS